MRPDRESGGNRAYISIFGRKHKASFHNLSVLHKLYELCVTHEHNFSKTTSVPGSQKFFPFFQRNFHLNLLRYRCRNIKRFSNLRPQKLPRQSSTNSCKTLERERSVTNVCHRDGSSVTLQLCDKGCTWCRFLRQKKLIVGSDEVLLSSLSLYCKLNGKHVSEMLKNSREVQ